MKIDVWSDMVCPFCYIGKRRLEKVLENSPPDEDVEIVFHAFELDPSAPKEAGGSMIESLAAKYGISAEEARIMNHRVGKMAEAEGLGYDADSMKLNNTYDAHRLNALAGQQYGEHIQQLFLNKVMTAYFAHGKYISDREVLTELAVEAGMDESRVREVLDSEEFSQNVRADESRARSDQISGVPYFVFNGSYALSGAQPEKEFEKALKKPAVLP